MADEAAWVPVLDGAQAAAARDAVRDVAEALAAGQVAHARPSETVVFWAYAAGAIDEPWTTDRYDAATDRLGTAIGDNPLGIALFGGLAGSGWTLAHISEEGAADEVLDAIDGALAETLAVEPWQADYDLVRGLVGLGVYFLERLATSSSVRARDALARVVDHLLAYAEETPQGLTWFTQPALLPPHQRVQFPDGYFNCGLAHGVPGVIALLGRIVERPDADPRARPALVSALRWMQAQALPAGATSRFPSVVGRDRPGQPARTAWCYGDAGIAIACWSAAVRAGLDPAPWRALASEAARRPSELCGTRDAGLCHGTAGLAHIFNRCYQASRDPVFLDAARRWYGKTLADRGAHGAASSLAGFSAYDATAERYVGRGDLVEGAPGVALALLAAVEPTEPGWDRCLQCDLPPVARL